MKLKVQVGQKSLFKTPSLQQTLKPGRFNMESVVFKFPYTLLQSLS